jgi:hypothetical protein
VRATLVKNERNFHKSERDFPDMVYDPPYQSRANQFTRESQRFHRAQLRFRCSIWGLHLSHSLVRRPAFG